MKFALVTADPSHKNQFRINPENGDATSFMQWIRIWNGLHLSYEALRNDPEADDLLKKFDVVMLSGHPSYMEDIVRIGKALKETKTLTMFYPEGSAQLYDNSINGYQPLYYEAWRACDILSIAEEDKVSYYESFVTDATLVSFIHVPITFEMASSMFFVPRDQKRDEIVVYGDNNPNHPLIALSAIEQLSRVMGKEFLAIGVETRDRDFKQTFPNLAVRQMTKQGQYPFLRTLGRTILNFYPTEWIGTARHQISCASVGTPCIGNRESHTQQRLFPRIMTNIYDIDSMKRIASDLLKSNVFYKEVTDYALKELRYYDMGNTCARFVDATRTAYKKFKGMA